MQSVIDGALFCKLILAGANRVITKQEDLNKINVFPVPDGDTGSNMAYTFSSIAQSIQGPTEGGLNTSTAAAAMADAAINGSLGNSGSIIAQFFQGVDAGCHGQISVNHKHFAETLAHAAIKARNAIDNPVEGTIITVMKDWGDWVLANFDKHTDFQLFFAESLNAAETSLQHTPDQLEVLSKNHVVDAGAQGFVHFLQGMHDFLTIGHIDNIKNEDIEQEIETETIHVENDGEVHLSHHHNDVSDADNLTNQFCTECVLHGDNINVESLRKEMARWGNSLVVVGNKRKVKVHIHTNAPEKVFKRANEFGDVLETKADDMWAQYRAAQNLKSHNKKIAILTDSACSLPQDFFVKNNIIIMPLQVVVNNQPYLDSVNITRAQFLKYLQESDTSVSTSQAALPEMKAVFDKGMQQSDSLIMLPLSSGISGTYNSLCKLRERYAEVDIHIIDSKSAAAGQGLVVKAAALKAAQGKSADEVARYTQRVADSGRQFITLSTLKYAVKGGRVKKSTGVLLNTLRIKPIMAFNHEGKIAKCGVGFGVGLSRKKMLSLAIKAAEKMRNPHFAISHLAAHDDALKFAEILKKRFNLKALPSQVEITPVVATHTGPGGISIAVADYF